MSKRINTLLLLAAMSVSLLTPAYAATEAEQPRSILEFEYNQNAIERGDRTIFLPEDLDENGEWAYSYNKMNAWYACSPQDPIIISNTSGDSILVDISLLYLDKQEKFSVSLLNDGFLGNANSTAIVSNGYMGRIESDDGLWALESKTTTNAELGMPAGDECRWLTPEDVDPDGFIKIPAGESISVWLPDQDYSTPQMYVMIVLEGQGEDYVWTYLCFEVGNISYDSTQSILVDGTPVDFPCRALKDEFGNDTNYVKLRDIAQALNGTAAQFQVGWNGAVNIETGKEYTPNGSEMGSPCIIE